MSYEVRIYAIDRRTLKSKDGRDITWGVPVACFELGGMNAMYDHARDFFKNEIDYELFTEEEYSGTYTDGYGERCKWANIAGALAWAHACYRHCEPLRRRIKPFIAWLEAVEPEEWNDLQLVYYGY